jgi:hypothetical protein
MAGGEEKPGTARAHRLFSQPHLTLFKKAYRQQAGMDMQFLLQPREGTRLPQGNFQALRRRAVQACAPGGGTGEKIGALPRSIMHDEEGQDAQGWAVRGMGGDAGICQANAAESDGGREKGAASQAHGFSPVPSSGFEAGIYCHGAKYLASAE